MTRLTDAFGVLHDISFEGWRLVFSQNTIDGTKPRGTFAASVRREDESKPQVFYGNTFLEVLRAAAFFIADSLDAEAVDDVEVAEVVSYTLQGTTSGLYRAPDQHIIESRTRVATRDGGSEWWRLRRKARSAQARPLSDWDYEELLITGTSVTSEAAAIHWVVEGRLR